MMLAIAIYLTALVAVVVFALIFSDLNMRIRRHQRRLRIVDARLVRGAEDVCWALCRDDAYSDALWFALRRHLNGDDRLLRDLGIALNTLNGDRPRLQVIK